MKSITKGNYIVRPFKVYKTFTYSFEYMGGANTSYFVINEALKPPIPWSWSGSNEEVNPSGIYKKVLHRSVEHMFYQTSHSVAFTGPLRDTAFDMKDIENVYVFSIAQRSIGERIQSGSVRLETPAGTGSVTDDGYGRLVSNNGSIVGNIFYDIGIGCIKRSDEVTSVTGSVIVHDGLYLESGDVINIEYNSTHTVYEHSVMCNIERGEFNYSTNPSVGFNSSSISGSGLLIDNMASGTLTPYITSIGLYNNDGILVGVGKFAKPIKRLPTIDQTFIVRFDI